MLYRMQFDGWIGGMLSECGLFSSNSESIEWWPAGSTAKWVKWAKKENLKPVDAACIALARTLVRKLEDGKMPVQDAKQVYLSAISLAETRGSNRAINELKKMASEIDELTRFRDEIQDA